MKTLVPIEVIEKKILLINGQKVMLDSDLAVLYGATTKRLNEQVRRNLKRFPQDFMYQLSQEEFESLKSHFATSSSWGGRRTRPFVFTEQGISMLSSVLRYMPYTLHPSPRLQSLFEAKPWQGADADFDRMRKVGPLRIYE